MWVVMTVPYTLVSFLAIWVLQFKPELAVLPLFPERLRQFTRCLRDDAARDYALKMFVAFCITGAGGVITAIGWSGAWAAEFARKLRCCSIQDVKGRGMSRRAMHFLAPAARSSAAA